MRLTLLTFALAALVNSSKATSLRSSADLASLATVGAPGDVKSYQEVCADIGIPTGAGSMTVDLLAAVTSTQTGSAEKATSRELAVRGNVGVSVGVGIGRLGISLNGELSVSSPNAPGDRALLTGAAHTLRSMVLTNMAASNKKLADEVTGVLKGQENLLEATLKEMGVGTDVKAAVPKMRLAVEVARAGMAKASSEEITKIGNKVFCFDGAAGCAVTDGTAGMSATLVPQGFYQTLSMTMTDLTIQKMFGGKSMTGGHFGFSCATMPKTFPVKLADLEVFLDPAVLAQVKAAFPGKADIPVPGQLLCHVAENDPYSPFLDTVTPDSDPTKWPLTIPTEGEATDLMAQSVQDMIRSTLMRKDPAMKKCTMADAALESGIFTTLRSKVGFLKPCRYTTPLAVANLWPQLYTNLAAAYSGIELDTGNARGEALSAAVLKKQWEGAKSLMMKNLRPAMPTAAGPVDLYDWTVREMRGVVEPNSAPKLRRSGAPPAAAAAPTPGASTPAPKLPPCVDYLAAPSFDSATGLSSPRPFLSFPAACGTAFGGPTFEGQGAAAAVAKLAARAVAAATTTFDVKVSLSAEVQVVLATKLPTDASTACTESPQSSYTVRVNAEQEAKVSRGPSGFSVALSGPAQWKVDSALVINFQGVAPIVFTGHFIDNRPQADAATATDDATMSLEVMFSVPSDAIAKLAAAEAAAGGASAGALGAPPADAKTVPGAARIAAQAEAVKFIAGAAARLNLAIGRFVAKFIGTKVSSATRERAEQLLLSLTANPAERCPAPAEEAEGKATAADVPKAAGKAEAGLKAVGNSVLGLVKSVGRSKLLGALVQPSALSVAKAAAGAAAPASVTVAVKSIEVTLRVAVRNQKTAWAVVEEETGIFVNIYETTQAKLGVGAATASLAYKAGDSFDTVSLASTLSKVLGIPATPAGEQCPAGADPAAAGLRPN